MKETEKLVNRRTFAKGLALAPLGLMATSSMLGQEVSGFTDAKPANANAPAQPANARNTPKPPAKPGIVETDPFAEALTFARKDAPMRLQPFALNEVQLLPGPLAEARDWNRAYMLKLSADRLLHNFRVNAGLPSSAEPLGGWEKPDCELRGHFVGHYLSACALHFAATGDREFRARGEALVQGIAACQDKLNDNGYVSAFPSEFFVRLDKGQNVWVPFYTLHKIMAGLLDMHTLAGNKQALDVLLKLSAWVDAWTESRTEEHMQEILRTEFGGMNEVLYNLAAVTGDNRWARAGDRFTKKSFFNPLAARRDELKGLHANTHMPQVIGAARRFEISSDPRFAHVSDFFFETVTEGRTYAAGGSGNNEHWLTQPGHLALEMKFSTHHQECCCAYNMMKLARHLFARSGDARYIEYYERNLFNHRLGAIQPESGLTTYFLSMSPGAWKTLATEDQTFWCCTGTAVEEYAKLNDSIYYHGDEDLYVNLYAASVLDWKQRGIRLRQTTSFPESDRMQLTVEASPANPWTMHLRIPAWTTAENRILINGKPLEVSGTPGSYLALKRAWKPGDRVEMTLPMHLSVETLPDDSSLQAFLYGPVVLAGQFPKEKLDFELEHNQAPEIQKAPELKVPSLIAQGPELEKWMKPVSNQSLTFRTTGQKQDVTLKPISQSWERYAVYFSVS